jgi:hypothetical protein
MSQRHSIDFLERTPPAAPVLGPSRRALRRQTTTTLQAPPPASAAVPESSTAITDWRAQGQAAARDITVGPPHPAHPFGHEFSPAPEGQEPGIFGPPNEHPAGTVEHFEEGDRVWVTASCYFDVNRHPEKKEKTGGADGTRTRDPGVTGWVSRAAKMLVFPAYRACCSFLSSPDSRPFFQALTGPVPINSHQIWAAITDGYDLRQYSVVRCGLMGRRTVRAMRDTQRG